MTIELAGVEQLERADDPLAVAGIDLRRGPRRAVVQDAVERRCAPPRELGDPVLARPLGRWRAQAKLGERRAQVQPRPTDDDRPRAGGEQCVDLGVRKLGVLAGAERGIDGQERDQPMLELAPARSRWRRPSASPIPGRPAARRRTPRPAARRARAGAEPARSRRRSCRHRSDRTGRSPLRAALAGVSWSDQDWYWNLDRARPAPGRDGRGAVGGGGAPRRVRRSRGGVRERLASGRARGHARGRARRTRP